MLGVGIGDIIGASSVLTSANIRSLKFCLHPGVGEQHHAFVVLQNRVSYRLEMCVFGRRIKVLVASPDPTAVDAT